MYTGLLSTFLGLEGEYHHSALGDKAEQRNAYFWSSTQPRSHREQLPSGGKEKYFRRSAFVMC